MSSATSKRIYLTRHAQAEHNVAEDYSIHDAPLTAFGREQAARLYENTKENIQKSAQLLVTSGLRRTLSTTLIGYPDLKARLEAEGKPAVVLPQLQETNPYPSDRGSDREVLESDPEFASKFDLSLLTPEWNKKEGFYASDPESLANRAKWVRRWLRDREEQEIVVVCHAAFLRYITDGFNSGYKWANTQVAHFTFLVEDDEDAVLVKVEDVYLKANPPVDSSSPARASS